MPVKQPLDAPNYSKAVAQGHGRLLYPRDKSDDGTQFSPRDCLVLPIERFLNIPSMVRGEVEAVATAPQA